jgi:cytochrome b6-f complex iron-sulfur subunit
MERQEFLKSLGLGFATVCAGACLASCGGGDDTSTPGNTTPPTTPPTTNPPPPATNTVTANLSSLTTVGSSTKVNSVLFFRIAAGDTASSFVATEAQCPHQGGNLNWIQGQDIIRCDTHSATFQKNGTNVSPPVGGGSARSLKIYSTTVNATSVIATLS